MTKRAVLIGINRYRIPGADLRGCVNDVKNLQGVLTRYYGFKADDIAVLTDLAATKKAIQAAIEELVRQGQPEDVLLLHYSGHGANVPDDDGDEADNRDEILCPTDLDWKDPLRDDWLRTTFDKLRTGSKSDCHHGLLPLRHQHPCVAAAGCADNPALSAQPLGHHGRGVRTQTARQCARRIARLPAGTAQEIRHRGGRYSGTSRYRLSRYPNLGRRATLAIATTVR